MTASRVRMLLATVSLTAVLAAGVPARAQMTVFDPSNYSQNLLTAARTLQQVNNGIQSLQNEAMFLLNQARNLASLPYSSLAQLQQSIGQTQQLLTQAQRIWDCRFLAPASPTDWSPEDPSLARALLSGPQWQWLVPVLRARPCPLLAPVPQAVPSAALHALEPAPQEAQPPPFVPAAWVVSRAQPELLLRARSAVLRPI